METKIPKLYVILYYNGNDERDFETIISTDDNYTIVQLKWLTRYNSENEDNMLTASHIIDSYEIDSSCDMDGNRFIISLTSEK